MGTLRSDDGECRRQRVSTTAAVTWGEWGEVAVVWHEKLTLRSSGGRGRLHNKFSGTFGILEKVWHPLLHQTKIIIYLISLRG